METRISGSEMDLSSPLRAAMACTSIQTKSTGFFYAGSALHLFAKLGLDLIRSVTGTMLTVAQSRSLLDEDSGPAAARKEMVIRMTRKHRGA